MRATTNDVMAAMEGFPGGWRQGPKQHAVDVRCKLRRVSSRVPSETTGEGRAAC